MIKGYTIRLYPTKEQEHMMWQHVGAARYIWNYMRELQETRYDNGAEILTELTDEIVYYNDALGLYVWGVTHFGTSWDYVLTDVRLEIAQE